MKKITLSLIVTLFCSLNFAWAQIQMPEPSPKASVMQAVGLTEVTIDYSSPAVKGREIWGGLEAYGQAWRAGANSPTKITFSREVMIDGTSVPAGSYNIFITPMEKGAWHVHLNKAGKSVFAYTKDGKQDREALMKDDIVTIKVEPKEAPMKERLAYYIEPNSSTEGTITMHWEKVAIPFSFKTDTDKYALMSIEEGMKEYSGLWYTFAKTANYYVDNDQSVDQAMTWVNQALAMKDDHFYPHWVKAKVLAAKGEKKEAIATAKAAQELGAKSGGNFYASMKDGMAKAMKGWMK